MTMLSDGTISDLMRAGHLRIDPEPLLPALQPASVDLCLGSDFMPCPGDKIITMCPHYTIIPGECVLASTLEEVWLPDNVVGRVEGKSSWGRQFLMVHSTAGFIDPGFHGTITLELKNLSPVNIVLPVWQPIAQISFEFTDKPVLRPYGTKGLGSRYQGQMTVTAPR